MDHVRTKRMFDINYNNFVKVQICTLSDAAFILLWAFLGKFWPENHSDPSPNLKFWDICIWSFLKKPFSLILGTYDFHFKDL